MVETRLMLPGEYARFSDAVRNSIRRASSAWVSESDLTNVMASIQAGARQVWLVYETPAPDQHKLVGILVTRILRGPRRTLYAEALANVDGAIRPSIWADGVKPLVSYAHREKCQTIECDINNELYARLLAKLGFRPVSIRYALEVPE